MRRRDHNILTNAASLLICGLLAGVVVAAAAFPAVAMSGLAAKAGAETFEQLPKELKDHLSPQYTRIYASDNRTQIAVMYDEFRYNVPLAEISKHMQDAIIAAEDHDFYSHNGVDLRGVVRAFVANKNTTTGRQGASTLTMQYVRMSIAYSATHPQDVVDATKPTASRKIAEMNYALQVEKQLSKQEILERYLNTAPFGNRTYGVYAASEVYFKKKPKDLTIQEAALLAGMVKGPSTYNPATAGGYTKAKDRRDWVIGQMVETKAITPEAGEAAKKETISKDIKQVGNGCIEVAKNNWGFFCDYFYRWWLEQETFGPTTYDRERRLKSGGYRIVTTLDLKAQKAAYDNVKRYYNTSKKHPNALMEAVVQPGTGRVRALAVNRTFKLDEKGENGISTDPDKARKNILGTYPNTTNPLITGGSGVPGVQAGSSFKMFAMVAALEKGLPLATSKNAGPVYRSKYIAGYGAPSACPGSNKWCPKNASPSMSGLHDMWSAFGKSVNTYFIPLTEQAGAANVIDVAQRLGIKFRSEEERNNMTGDGADGQGAFTLGTTATTPLDLANSYATLAADGKYCETIPVQEIKDHSGEKLDVANPRCKRAVSPDVARAAVDAARCPVGDQSAFGKCRGATERSARGVVGHPVFGKSGTTDNDRTATLVVGTKSLVVAGILADPDNPRSYRKMDHDIVNPAVYRTLAEAMEGRERQEFERPSTDIAFGDQRSIPGVACDSRESAESRLRNAGFQVETQSSPVPSSCPPGTAAGTVPSGQTIEGGFVMLQISGGGARPDQQQEGDDQDDDNPDRRNERPGG